METPPPAHSSGPVGQVDRQMDRCTARQHLDLGPTHSSLTPLDQGTVTSGSSTFPSTPSDDDADRNLQGRGRVRIFILFIS